MRKIYLIFFIILISCNYNIKNEKSELLNQKLDSLKIICDSLESENFELNLMNTKYEIILERSQEEIDTACLKKLGEIIKTVE